MSLYEQGGIGWLNKLADMSSPDGRLKRRIEAEKDWIIQALRIVGEYAIEMDGRMYLIRAERGDGAAKGQEPRWAKR